MKNHIADKSFVHTQISLDDMQQAWRKAKVDLFYTKTPPLLAMANYEENLIDNLKSLHRRIEGDKEEWISEAEFLGGWSLLPKSIVFASEKDSESQHCSKVGSNMVVFSDSRQEWEQQLEQGRRAVAEFRVMAECSIDFHVLSALWLMKVGTLFDQKLSKNVYGSRLRRRQDGEFSVNALGSFKPYLKPYRDWRDGALKAMETELAAGKKVVALTADITSFYHELNAGFMLSDDFLELVGVKTSGYEKLHRVFIKSLEAWAKITPLGKGLPVGLPASSVVANAALIPLDRFIEQQLVPRYYGRYVDDILLVIENTSNITSADQFWAWVFSHDAASDILKNTANSVRLDADYLGENSKIEFSNNKNKLFVLSGSAGSAMVATIRQQINQRSSEWRALPVLPESPESIASDLLKATSEQGEYADSLRKTNALTMHRANLALSLRNYEAYARDLPLDAWRVQRRAFFNAVIDHLLTPVAFFELSDYLPRIVRLATDCEEFTYLAKLLNEVEQLTKDITNLCKLGIKALSGESSAVKEYLQEYWRKKILNTLAENVLCALPSNLTKSSQQQWRQYLEGRWFAGLDVDLGVRANQKEAPCIKRCQQQQARLFSHDLANTALRFAALPKEMICQRGIPARKVLPAVNWQLVDDENPNVFNELANYFQPKLVNGTPAGLYFPTRPFEVHELSLVIPKAFSKEGLSAQARIICTQRGFIPEASAMPHWDEHRNLLIPNVAKSQAKQTIAVASWEAKASSFEASVKCQPDPDVRQRYERLNRLVNELISRPDNASYLVLPELAIPARWFIQLAQKLHARRISLISGVEYLHAKKRVVRNQVWAALAHEGLGFSSLMLYRQDKQSPAPHEETELFKLNGVRLKPEQPWSQPPIIQHGKFHFALLICSELTNIHNRAALRGKIDAMFALEWNSDIDTFNALVESAALDIHAYIIQCNNRLYGDSRIRAPYKERWMRDVLRVKGGNHDYCVTGEIDVQALRKFQSNHRSPEKPFKPVPDGFKQTMAQTRKELA